MRPSGPRRQSVPRYRETGEAGNRRLSEHSGSLKVIRWNRARHRCHSVSQCDGLTDATLGAFIGLDAPEAG